jgi:predicted transcriptional regulator
MIFHDKQKPVIDEVQSQYAPLRLGLQKDSTLTNNIYEFFVIGTRRGDEDGPEKILRILQEHRAKLVSVNLFPSGEAGSDFTLTCMIDGSKLDCQADSLLIAFRKFRFVNRAEKSKMNGRTFSAFLFPLLIANNQRSVVLDAQTLLSLEVSLGNVTGLDEKVVSSILLEMGRKQGTRIFKEQIQSNLVPAQKQDDYFIDSIKTYMIASGWGVFSASFVDGVSTAYLINPPVFERGSVAPLVGGSFLRGLVLGLLESRAGNVSRLAVSHENYSKERRLLSMYLGNENEVRAFQEVQKNQEQPVGIREAISSGSASQIMTQVDGGDNAAEHSEVSINISLKEPSDSIDGPSPIVPSFDAKGLAAGLGETGLVMKILKMCTTGTQKIRLMDSARLTLSRANEYIERMMKADLLEAKKAPGTENITYYTTKKGEDFQRVQEKLEHMLQES